MNVQKRAAAEHALQYLESGMRLGLGTGSTTAFFVDLLGEKLKSGELRDIYAVPTSMRTVEQARRWGIPLVSLGDHPVLDLAVDGADEVDPNLDLVKGLGKALLREKLVEVHARRLVIIVDESKLVDRLGRGPLPIEIVQFEWRATVNWLNSLGCRAELWRDENEEPYVTDNGNYLARCWFDAGIPDTHALARRLADRPGVLEHGLFLKMADEVVVAGREGVRVLERERRR